MGKSTAALLPATATLLEDLGKRIELARRRRKITSAQMASRAGMSVVTYRNIERGSSNVTIGAYAAVLQVLQLEQGIGQLAADDPLGRVIQDSELLRAPRRGRKSKSAYPVAENPAGQATQETGLADAVSADDLLDLLQPPK